MKPTIDMTVSPFDRGDAAAQPLVRLRYVPRPRWIPSRYNARTVGDDGRLILWNTFTGAVCVFTARDRERVLRRLEKDGVAEPLDRTAEFLGRRGFLVRQGTDELDRFRYWYGRTHWRSDLLQLILMATEDCNFRCVYCFEKFERGTMSPEVRQGVRALVLRRASSLSSLSVSWFGGEPLYGWEAVEELSPFFLDVAKRHGIAHDQAMTTNGYLLTEEKATRLLEWGCTRYQITVDGLAEEHDCRRVGRDGSPTHAVVLDNLRSLKARKTPFDVSIRVNFDRENVPRLGPFLEALSEDFGGDARFKLCFRAVGRWGGDNDDQLAVCGTGEARQVVTALRETARGLGLRHEGGIRDVARFGAEVCYAARPYNFVVGASGKLMKCTVVLYELDDNIVGQLHPDGRVEVDDERMARWVKPHYESDASCRGCHVLPVCQGASCPLSRVTHGTRTCSTTRGTLKREMRLTLEHDLRTPAPRAVAKATAAGAAV